MARAMVIPQPGDVAVDAVTSALERHGLAVIRTFDLRQKIGSDETARAPVEQSAPCICQYAVLLTYGGERDRWSSLLGRMTTPPTSRCSQGWQVARPYACG